MVGDHELAYMHLTVYSSLMRKFHQTLSNEGYLIYFFPQGKAKLTNHIYLYF